MTGDSLRTCWHLAGLEQGIGDNQIGEIVGKRVEPRIGLFNSDSPAIQSCFSKRLTRPRDFLGILLDTIDREFRLPGQLEGQLPTFTTHHQTEPRVDPGRVDDRFGGGRVLFVGAEFGLRCRLCGGRGLLSGITVDLSRGRAHHQVAVCRPEAAGDTLHVGLPGQLPRVG